MQQVYTIGETVLDIIFQDGKPVTAKPGGAMLNTAVSLGRAGIPVHFISDFGLDKAGDIIARFLRENDVSSEFVQRYMDGKTALSLAFLDEEQNADYSFYKIFPKERLSGSFPVITGEDILLFGSFYAITSEIRGRLVRFVRQAVDSGAIIMYDPNFRKSHLGELEELKPMILENLSYANIIRGSDEDFLHIFASGDAQETYGRLPGFGKEGVNKWLIYTRSLSGIVVRGRKMDFSVPVPEIRPVSTIGAGDAFNAGLIFYLVKNKITLEGLSKMDHKGWKKMIGIAIRFAQDVCLSYDNYISTGLIKHLELC